MSAADPEGLAPTYSIVGGNESGLFEIDPATGALSYTGTGEDHESGTTRYALTVRASDDHRHSDVRVTVNVTDVDEEPAFGATSYAFELAENAEGGTNRVVLGTVSATDPENSALTYSITGGNGESLFGIDAATGEVYYTGSGEDHESGTASHELTVRASDDHRHSDVRVTVNVTDVDEEPAFAETELRLRPGGERRRERDRGNAGHGVGGGPRGFGADVQHRGRQRVGAVRDRPRDRRAVVHGHGRGPRVGDHALRADGAGERRPPAQRRAVTVNVTDVDEEPAFGATSYAFALEENADGSETGVALGTVSAADPENSALTYSITGGNGESLFGIDAATGEVYYTGSGEDHESGTASHELTVRASDDHRHSDVRVTVNVTDVDEEPAFADQSYAFDLEENADGSETGVTLGTVSAADPEGLAPTYSIVGGTESGLFEIDPATGALSYTGTGEDHESGTTRYVLTVRASDDHRHSDVRVTVNVTNVDEAPAFAETSYAFALEENADGSETGVALGTVSAADPEGLAPTYSIVGGTESERFEIDAATGALSYIGTGEDYESGADGACERRPAVSSATWRHRQRHRRGRGAGLRRDELRLRAGGERRRERDRGSAGHGVGGGPRGLGATYSIVGGVFSESTRRVYYTGSGEDHESGTASHELTVRASDDHRHSDVRVTVNVTDVDEEPAFADELRLRAGGERRRERDRGSAGHGVGGGPRGLGADVQHRGRHRIGAVRNRRGHGGAVLHRHEASRGRATC